MSENEERIRSEAMRHLAVGVARDLSAALTVLNGHAHLLLNRKSTGSAADQSVREICVASDGAARVARDLRAFAGTNILQSRNLLLGEFIESLAPLMRPVLGETVELRLKLVPPGPAIQADPDLLEHLLMNLVSVAADAMPAGGVLTLVTRTGPDRVAEPALHLEFSRWFVPREAWSRLFEPFSDIPLAGARGGPGLRLAAALGIVRQHGGRMEVESDAETGTRLLIGFPSARPVGVRSTPAPARDPGPASPSAVRAAVTILLVEDDDAVRNLSALMLKDLGYRVLQADSSKAALESWKWYADRIDLLFSDIVLPGDLTGLDLARTFQAQRPGLRVVLASGSLEEIAGDTKLQLDALRLLQKPYGLQRLAAIVGEALADHPMPPP